MTLEGRKLAELAAGFASVPVPGDIVVRDITLDSRAASPGSLFLACQGRTSHGLIFAQQAVARGASAVLYEDTVGQAKPDLGSDIFVAAVPQLSQHVGAIADRFFGAPSAAVTVVGITGTNGKTTCAWLLAQALQYCGRPAAYMGTLGFGVPPLIQATEHTTSDAVSVHRQIAALRDLGAECVCMEVSSHAIDQARVGAVRFNTAAFTNLTRDHLDYHGTMEAYGAAKARLFQWPSLTHRVINVDDAFGAELAAQLSSSRLVITSRVALSPVGSLKHAQQVRAVRATPEPTGLAIDIESSWGNVGLTVPLIGEFNVDNVLTVLAVLLAWNIPLAQAVTAIEKCRAPSGRMELFGGRAPAPLAIVDYAHTPDALVKALHAARLHCRGQLRVVFGCGGDRDAGKRALMGGIAAELADDVIVTDDNPRTEDPARIVADILAGMTGVSAAKAPRTLVEHDRARAIQTALRRSGPGDVVLIAGKGHEDYQIYGTVRRPFRDQSVVSAQLQERKVMKRTLGDFAQACGGTLQGADRDYKGVSSDTRTLAPGDLFIALRGPRYNGNEFVSAAFAAGAAGALVDSPQTAAIAQIVVPDTQAALEKAARAWRAQFPIPVIGVAGSNGKTTAKEMTAAILGAAGECLATRGNLNNHIGVPLTVLRLAPTHRYAVIEMGANRAGDVAALVEIAHPTVGLITNAGAEHLEGFGSIEGVARAEGEMVAGLEPGATAVINADDEFADLWRSVTPGRVVTFGVQKTADFAATDIATSVGADGFLTRFNLVSPLGRVAIELRMGGKHNIMNALAAAAAATAAGARLEHVAAGLGAVRAVAGRLQFKMTATGAWLIDDSYNANPSSVRAGIEVLAGLDGRKWLVLGDMAELGDFAASSHTEIGVFAREHGIEQLFATGKLAALAVESFGRGGQWFAEPNALAEALRAAPADVRMLIKGSRVNRLERVVDALVAAATGQTGRH